MLLGLLSYGDIYWVRSLWYLEGKKANRNMLRLCCGLFCTRDYVQLAESQDCFLASFQIQGCTLVLLTWSHLLWWFKDGKTSVLCELMIEITSCLKFQQFKTYLYFISFKTDSNPDQWELLTLQILWAICCSKVFIIWTYTCSKICKKKIVKNVTFMDLEVHDFSF